MCCENHALRSVWVLDANTVRDLTRPPAPVVPTFRTMQEVANYQWAPTPPTPEETQRILLARLSADLDRLVEPPLAPTEEKEEKEVVLV